MGWCGWCWIFLDIGKKRRGRYLGFGIAPVGVFVEGRRLVGHFFVGMWRFYWIWREVVSDIWLDCRGFGSDAAGSIVSFWKDLFKTAA